ncbi:PepSY domain-containing protein [Beijerinckia sp. L45]|uniref:PepSY domain-containing protein n=1 Tax=Beijerinckia sp. L45 TaxID=1641855 RepID=UPI00131DE225|nr:PepSY domain-containing protein [Beijerinckia sp. L45]
MKIAALVLVALVGGIACARAADAMHPPLPPLVRPLPPPPMMRPPPPPFVEGPHPHVEAMHRPEPARIRTCFNPAETREKIISRRLSEPFGLFRGAAGRVQGEALRAKLCRWNEDYVYEIALLRRDGHIIHVYINATSGQSLGAFNDH